MEMRESKQKKWLYRPTTNIVSLSNWLLTNDQWPATTHKRSSRKAWLLTTTLVIFPPFLFPPKKRGKKKRRLNSKNQKSCLSARSLPKDITHTPCKYLHQSLIKLEIFSFIWRTDDPFINILLIIGFLQT